VRGAGVAEPEMFTTAEFPPVAVERRVEVRRTSFRQEQFAFAQGTESCTWGWRTSAAWLGPVFSSVELLPESSKDIARERPNMWPPH
jgi:hypothetical protein